MALGILPKNENRGDEMIEIVAHHHQFVPVEESIEERISLMEIVSQLEISTLQVLDHKAFIWRQVGGTFMALLNFSELSEYKSSAEVTET